MPRSIVVSMFGIPEAINQARVNVYFEATKLMSLDKAAL